MTNNTRFIARQPILDTHLQCVGHELLYRDSVVNRAQFSDPEQASLQTLESAYLFGMETLCGEGKAFINCTAALLTSDLLRVLPADRTVLEIPESVTPTPEVVRACNELRASGYQIALDGFIPADRSEGLVDCADILKADFRTTAPDVRAAIATRFKNKTLLADKVETQEGFEEARGLGYSLFQGYFFHHPQVMATQEVSASRISHMRLLQAAMNEEFQLALLEKVIKEDAALCYRLLRFVNSAAFGLRSSVGSIRHALSLLGEKGTRRWVILTTTVMAADGQPTELLRCALHRARMGELLAPQAKYPEYEGFLLGLFSLAPAILGTDPGALVAQVELPARVSAALVGKEGRLKTLLSVVTSYERGNWGECEEAAASLSLTEHSVSAAYIESAQWLSQIPL